MNKVIVLVVAGVMLAAGYWWGQHQAGTAELSPASPHSERKILYYRNPMGQPDTSPVPKKDSMGMDYIPVYEGDDDDAGTVKVAPGRRQVMGVRTEPVQRDRVATNIQVVGRIESDERRQHVITAKFDGYIERLHVNAIGQPVQQGQALFEVYSPELVNAQRDYRLALQGIETLGQGDDVALQGMQNLAQASLSRLRNWDIPESQLAALQRSGEVRRTLTLRAPASGIVTEKNSVEGQRFSAGEVLYRLVDLSQVWLIAQVLESDLGQVAPGQSVSVRVDAYPGEAFHGAVSYIYTNLDPDTRTVPVRVELPNPDARLKPGMFASAEIVIPAPAPVLLAPASSVMDNGREQYVLVEQGEGRFAPRTVKVGQRRGAQVEILEGLAEGEPVVVAANFLIDADARMQAAVTGFAAASEDDAHAHHAMEPVAIDPDLPRHAADGRVESISADSIMLTHGPVPSLHWPPMTMPFSVADAALLHGLEPGQEIRFEFVEPGPGQWIITSLQRVSDSASPKAEASHDHHDHH